MNVASLMMRAIDGNGDVYVPYTFGGGFTNDEQRVIAAAFKPHVPERVDAMFNNWILAKYGKDHFTANRATWYRGGLVAKTAQELADKITNYYKR